MALEPAEFGEKRNRVVSTAIDAVDHDYRLAIVDADSKDGAADFTRIAVAGKQQRDRENGFFH